MKKLLFFATLIIFVGFWSCTKKTTGDPTPIIPTTKTTKDLVVPASFDFQTTKEIALGIVVKNSSSNLSDVPVSVYLDNPGPPESPRLDARLYGTYTSQADGSIDATIKVPYTQDSLYLSTNFIGLESESGFAFSGSTATYTYGQGNTIKSAPLFVLQAAQNKATVVYSYIGAFNNSGLPLYLVTPRDPISQSLLNDVNASLPERVKLTVSHPQYLKSDNEGDVILTKDADVWITFVSEGAGYMNAIGYYTYNAANPPADASKIAKHNIIFPNASLPGSGGSLQSGDKVFLGRFTAGTGIGWFIVANGWNNTTVAGQTIYYSEPSFNPESTASLKQHTVLLADKVRNLNILGFEDLNRVTGGSDEDFNDALFYVTANPASAIDGTSVPLIDTPLDDDKDGVTNAFDEFPNDAKRAHTSYYPGKDQYNSLLVEDLWPSLGDFDFNDLVVDCNFKNVTNAQTNVVEMFIKLKVRAIGASYKNGFGIQLPVAPSVVSSVTLTDQSGTVKSIGVEAGQDKTVVIAFDNAFTLLPSTGGSGVNVIQGNGWSEPKDIELHILFTTPQTVANLGTAPFNPFIYVNGDRTKEIHMAGAKPTNKASTSFFGQSSDSSNPATGRYYKSTNNLIWMMEVPSSFQYPIETNDITKSYLKFGAWAESGGSQFTDWYLDKTGYRNSSLIYKK